MFFSSPAERKAYETWLSELKVGDKVAMLIAALISNEHYMFGMVVHITPSRNRFDVQVYKDSSPYRFDRGGQEVGKGYRGTAIQPITEEIKLSHRSYLAVRGIEDFKDWEKLPLEDLEKIVAMIQGYKKAHPQKKE